MGESRRGGSDRGGNEETDTGTRAVRVEPGDGETALRSDGTRLASLGDRLGIDALGRLSWRRRWVGGNRPWRVSATAFPRDGTLREKAQFLLQYAVLAPSSHNTQPWLFNVADDEIRLFADLNRWLTVADPDKRELYLSLGAALENLLIAADHFGLDSAVQYLPGSDTTHAATVRLSEDGERSRQSETNKESEQSEERAAASHEKDSDKTEFRETESRDSELFEAIPHRRTTRGKYEKRAIPREELRALREAVTEKTVTEEDVTLQFVTDPMKLEEIATLAARADRRLFADPAYRRELARWIDRGALGHSWAKAKLAAFVIRHLNVGRQRARSDRQLLRNAPVLAVLRTASDSRKAQIRAGQAFQRMSLVATTRDLRTHSMSALLEVSALRHELADLLGRAGGLPQHLFRLGYAEEASATPPSPRRSANAVLVD